MSEELDDLASAYVDGEASPEEMNRVEKDPELLALVEEFRALRTSTLPLPEADPGLREAHIASALAAFDAQQQGRPSVAAATSSASTSSTPESSTSESSTPTVDADSDSSSPKVTSLSERRARKGLPGWMLNAAAAVVVVGGIGFALTQLPESSEDAALETSGADMAEEASDLSSAAPLSSDTMAAQEAGSSAADAAVEESADEAMEDEAMESEDTEAQASDDHDTGETASDDPASTSTTVARAVDPVVAVGDESARELLDAMEQSGGYEALLAPRDETNCFDAVAAADAVDEPGPALGYVAVTYGEIDAQLLLFGDPEAPTPVLVDAGCMILSSA